MPECTDQSLICNLFKDVPQQKKKELYTLLATLARDIHSEKSIAEGRDLNTRVPEYIEHSSSNFFKDVPHHDHDEGYALLAAYSKDTHPDKVSCIVGAYRDERGEPYVLPVVRSVERRMAHDDTLNHEYLPIEGSVPFRKAARKLMLGKDLSVVTENRTCTIQTISGSGALRVAFEFVRKSLPEQKTVLISRPTWGNHEKIIHHAGFTDVREYRYFDPVSKLLDLRGMLDDLQTAPDNSVLLLHACGHNPSGVDPSKEEWKQILELVKIKKMFIIFDVAYQGFVSGCPDNDAWAVRYFVSEGTEMLICQSFSKIFGLYSERAGALTAVCRTRGEASSVLSQLRQIVRPMYSNPPNHGAHIVATILNDPTLEKKWLTQLKSMVDRITRTRSLFYEKLRANNTPGDWSYIVSQKGMFTLSSLKAKHVEILRQKYHIYMLKSGRISICGINPGNVDYVANAVKDVVGNTPVLQRSS